MKVLVVYDTVSPQKVTAKVAETICKTLKDKEIDAESLYTKNVDQTTIKNYDALLVGAPTMYFRATSGITRFLKNLPNKNYSGKLAASFDTQVPKWYSGNAAKTIEKKLKKLDFKIIAPPLITYVESKADNWRLIDGELEKTKKWALEVANTILKQ